MLPAPALCTVPDRNEDSPASLVDASHNECEQKSEYERKSAGGF